MPENLSFLPTRKSDEPFFLTYKLFFYIPPFLDHGKRNFTENTIDFFFFGWHFTKASVFNDYIEDKDESLKELAKAGWYRKKYLAKRFEVKAENIYSVLEIYKELNVNSVLEELYSSLMREKNQELNFLFEAGKIFIINENWEMAGKAFSMIVDSRPDDVMGHYYLGLSYLNLKNLMSAAQCFERAMELNPDFADVYFQLGNIAEKDKNGFKAKSLYEKTLDILPFHLDSLKALKRIYKKLE